MIVLSVLGFGLGIVAQLAALFASSKLATANGPVVEVTGVPSIRTTAARYGSDASNGGEPAWANLMRGM